MIKRSDITLCPFFRLIEYDSEKNSIVKFKRTIEGMCALDDFIYAWIKTRKEKITKHEKNLLKKKMFSRCSRECPKMWDIEVETSNVDIPKDEDPPFDFDKKVYGRKNDPDYEKYDEYDHYFDGFSFYKDWEA